MAARKQMDLLTAVEQIVERAKGTGLSSEFYRKADRPIRHMAEKMELTKEQSVMMALFIDNSDDTSITISDFGKFLDCRTTRIIRYMPAIDVLEKRELVRCSRGDNRISYRVPIEVVDAFKNNQRMSFGIKQQSPDIVFYDPEHPEGMSEKEKLRRQQLEFEEVDTESTGAIEAADFKDMLLKSKPGDPQVRMRIDRI